MRITIRVRRTRGQHRLDARSTAHRRGPRAGPDGAHRPADTDDVAPRPPRRLATRADGDIGDWRDDVHAP